MSDMCKTCRYKQQLESKVECRYNPPTYAGFPEINLFSWCGKYQTITQDIKTVKIKDVKND